MKTILDGVNGMAAESHQIAMDKGFFKDTPEGKIFIGGDVPCLLLLIHSEVSEAAEVHRRGSGRPGGYDREAFASELADIVLRVGSLAGFLDIDLGQAVVDKIKVNRSRPHLHGGKAY